MFVLPLAKDGGGQGDSHKSLGVILLTSHFTTDDHKLPFLLQPFLPHMGLGVGRWGGYPARLRMIASRARIYLLCLVELLLPRKEQLWHIYSVLGFIVMLKCGNMRREG